MHGDRSRDDLFPKFVIEWNGLTLNRRPLITEQLNKILFSLKEFCVLVSPGFVGDNDGIFFEIFGTGFSKASY